jgi:hypothetical protein
LRRTLKPAVLHLASLVQQPVQRRFAGNVAPLIGQAGNDLAWREIFKLLTVEKRHGRVPLECAEFVGRLSTLMQAGRPAVASAVIRVLPALHGARRQANLGAGLRQARTARAGLPNQLQQVFALLDSAHQATSPNSAWNFFCNTSKAAASASALSFRRRSRCNPSCLVCSSRNAALVSRASLAGVVQKASRQAFSWCSNNPFSRHQTWSCVWDKACVSSSA